MKLSSRQVTVSVAAPGFAFSLDPRNSESPGAAEVRNIVPFLGSEVVGIKYLVTNPCAAHSRPKPQSKRSCGSRPSPRPCRHKADFNNAEDKEWTPAGASEPAGKVRSSNNFHFMQVRALRRNSPFKVPFKDTSLATVLLSHRLFTASRTDLGMTLCTARQSSHGGVQRGAHGADGPAARCAGPRAVGVGRPPRAHLVGGSVEQRRGSCASHRYHVVLYMGHGEGPHQGHVQSSVYSNFPKGS